MRSKTFNTGRPCAHGHTSDRYASGKACVECVRLSNRIKNDATIHELEQIALFYKRFGNAL